MAPKTLCPQRNNRHRSSQELDKARVHACAAYFQLLGKITSAGLSIAFIFFCAKLRRTWPIHFCGFVVSQSYAYDVCGSILFAACFAEFLVLYRISKLIEELDIEALNKIRIHPSIWNFLADFGSSRPAQFQSCFMLGFLIVAWWLSYTTVSLLSPNESLGGLQVMLLGSGILCLCAIRSCALTMRRASSSLNRTWFTLPLIGSITAQDIVAALAIAIGGSIALIADAFVRTWG